MADTPIKCPKCGKTVEVVTPFVSAVVNPNFYCPGKGCGMKGVLRWERKSGKVTVTKS